MLASLSPDSSIHLALKTCRWETGTDVVVSLAGQYFEVQCPQQVFRWEGEHSLVDFDVRVAHNAPLGSTTLKYDISIQDVIVARLRLDIKTSRLPSFRKVNAPAVRPAQTAFASYAYEDRSRALDRIAAAKISAGLDVRVDCLSLNPGEQWKSRLRQEICQRDLFLLFWSHHAKESEWVSWEWHTALEEKDEPAPQLHPLETPQEAPPPGGTETSPFWRFNHVGTKGSRTTVTTLLLARSPALPTAALRIRRELFQAGKTGKSIEEMGRALL